MAEQIEFDFSVPLDSLTQLWTPDDIYGSCDQHTIELFREDGRVERKRVEVSVRDLADYLSMWSNTQPSGGVVFIGVSDTGEILGCNHAEQRHINDLEAVRRLCSDARIEFKRVRVTNAKGEDDFVMALRVYYRDDRLVETAEGNAFIRQGDEKRRLTETEKREIRYNKGELDCELEPVNLKFPDDFDQELLKEYYNSYITKRNLTNPYTIEDVLQLSKLGKRTPVAFLPNLACALLFANDPRAVVPGAYIRVITYDGVEEQFGQQLNTVASQLIEGPLPRQIAEVERLVLSQMRNFTRLGPDSRFVTKPEYPRDVWFEAIVNAVSHRSYNLRNMNIFVKKFEDKLVVESPGTFMPPTTADTVYEAHNPRNPHLMWALYYFDFVQCAFEGTRRMREGMRAASLPDPLFVQKSAGVFQVSVTLKNDVEHRKAFVRAELQDVVSKAIFEGLNQDEKMIINYLADRGTLNVTDAGLLISKDWRETKAVMDKLETKGVIARTPGRSRDRHRRYYLPKSKLV